VWAAREPGDHVVDEGVVLDAERALVLESEARGLGRGAFEDVVGIAVAGFELADAAAAASVEVVAALVEAADGGAGLRGLPNRAQHAGVVLA
jgi:hypothetical protein